MELVIEFCFYVRVCLCVKFKSLKLILILILEFVSQCLEPLHVSIQQNQQKRLLVLILRATKKDKCHTSSKTQPNKSFYYGYMNN